MSSEDLRCFFYLLEMPKTMAALYGIQQSAAPKVVPRSYGNLFPGIQGATHGLPEFCKHRTTCASLECTATDGAEDYEDHPDEPRICLEHHPI
jgi:hypothetical protein